MQLLNCLNKQYERQNYISLDTEQPIRLRINEWLIEGIVSSSMIQQDVIFYNDSRSMTVEIKVTDCHIKGARIEYAAQ